MSLSEGKLEVRRGPGFWALVRFFYSLGCAAVALGLGFTAMMEHHQPDAKALMWIIFLGIGLVAPICRCLLEDSRGRD